MKHAAYGGPMGLEVLVEGLAFGEGPRWHDGRLWYSDFFRHVVEAVTPDGERERIVDVPGQPSGLGWMPDGRLLIVSMVDHRVMAWDGSTLTAHADLTDLVHGECNDMVVAPDGTAYVGNKGYNRYVGEEFRTTTLCRVRPDGSADVVADDLWFPNGSVITPDGRTLVVGETQGHRLTAWTIDADGSLFDQRVWADLSDADGGAVWPDGICLDAEDAIWVADPRGNRVVRVHEGGRISDTVPTGDRMALACMLGGDDRRTLYIHTNVTTGPDTATLLAGRIESTRVDVPGAGLP